jgi:hypothetical protein
MPVVPFRVVVGRYLLFTTYFSFIKGITDCYYYYYYYYYSGPHLRVRT